MAVSWEALKAAAESSFKEGDYAAAAAGYSQALESLPAQEGLTQERSKLLSNRCASLQKLARWEDAEHDAREAVKLAPDWEKGKASGRKARLADQLRHHNLAAAAVWSGSTVCPALHKKFHLKLWPWCLPLGALCRGSRRPPCAAGGGPDGAPPAAPAAWYRLGMSLLNNRGKRTEAKLAFQQGLRLKPGNGQLRQQVGCASWARQLACAGAGRSLRPPRLCAAPGGRIHPQSAQPNRVGRCLARRHLPAINHHYPGAARSTLEYPQVEKLSKQQPGEDKENQSAAVTAFRRFMADVTGAAATCSSGVAGEGAAAPAAAAPAALPPADSAEPSSQQLAEAQKALGNEAYKAGRCVWGGCWCSRTLVLRREAGREQTNK